MRIIRTIITCSIAQEPVCVAFKAVFFGAVGTVGVILVAIDARLLSNVCYDNFSNKMPFRAFITDSKLRTSLAICSQRLKAISTISTVVILIYFTVGDLEHVVADHCEDYSHDNAQASYHNEIVINCFSFTKLAKFLFFKFVSVVFIFRRA